MDDFLIRVEKAVSVERARGAGPPNQIAIHPETWYALVRMLRDRPMTFTDAPVPRPTLFGMEVREDASLAPNTWRLERNH